MKRSLQPAAAPIRHARSHAWTAAGLPWLLLTSFLLSGGCATTRAPTPVAEGQEIRRVDVERVRPPRWSSAEVGMPAGSSADGAGRVLFDDPSVTPVLFSPDPELMRAEVAAECRAVRAMGLTDGLSPLVVTLYLSVADPAEATAALIGGDCAPVDEIVREMIAKGGPEVAPAVLAGARMSNPGGNRRALDVAAAQGLTRHAAARGLDVGPVRGTRHQAMAYHPSVAEAARVRRSEGQDQQLYRQAVPGFGVYTFVLIGADLEGFSVADHFRHRELFRLIETYAPGQGADPIAPSPGMHVFLVPVDAELSVAPLSSQVSADLADRMRLALIAELNRRGQARVAERLARARGPFLVASLGPTLLSEALDRPLLIADLSALGAEHLYGVVDAFDRAIPPESSGTMASLSAIRERLQAVVPGGSDARAGAAAADEEWIFMVESAPEASAESPPLDDRALDLRRDRASI
ncbi:MAG: hypothetical protein EOM91_05635 [Sphingobacteriia bacterium]|nr:hypothetical protein [Sphingobacteriia bacterium]NCC40121.1 hypothetical protein [Gammaproteobacteria bacterium]